MSAQTIAPYFATISDRKLIVSYLQVGERALHQAIVAWDNGDLRMGKKHTRSAKLIFLRLMAAVDRQRLPSEAARLERFYMHIIRHCIDAEDRSTANELRRPLARVAELRSAWQRPRH